MTDIDLLAAARDAASDTLDEWLHKSYVTYPDGLQRRFAKQEGGTWKIYRLDEDGGRPVESELVIQVTTADSADTDQSWLELYEYIAARVRKLYSEHMRNDICEPIAFQNVMEAINYGMLDYDNTRTLDTTDEKE